LADGHGKRFTRRSFLTRSASGLALAGLGNVASPYLSFAASRPVLTHGLQSGDVAADSGIVWARADRPSRMLIEASTTESFRDICCTTFADALGESDFVAKVLLDDLPAGQEIFFRVTPHDHASLATGEVQRGRFRTAPADTRSVSFVWSGDTAGQGWGIDEARGGMRTFRTMLDNRPDFFIHSGDSIYADCPIERELKLPDGGIWRNLVTEEKSQVAQSLAEFRGNYKYNLFDANVRAFNAEVPVLAQWDDHEVANDWWPTRSIDEAGYADRSALQLAARAGRAFHEYMPTRQTLAEPGRIYRKIAYGPLLDMFLLDMRSYRGPNDAVALPAPLLGAKQIAWLKRELAASKATWKVIAADMPIGLVSCDAVARGDGPPAGRENEIADLLSFIKRSGVKNTVWLTADMHYTAAHHYDPNRAVFQDFEPFWEFVSGPLHAGTWGPAPLDNTFGPQVRYQHGCSAEQGENLAPCFGLQFFGKVDIDGASGVMTVTLKDVGDRDLWSVQIEPAEPRLAVKFAERWR
jgi:alkaline phosphatase D